MPSRVYDIPSRCCVAEDVFGMRGESVRLIFSAAINRGLGVVGGGPELLVSAMCV